jgi:hypothetical protein
MDRMNQYRDIIRQAIDTYSQWSTDRNGVGESIIDPLHDHYEVIRHGRQNERRLHNVVVHLDIIDGKI